MFHIVAVAFCLLHSVVLHFVVLHYVALPSQSGHNLHWAPSSKKVTDVRKLITSLIEGKLNISIDQPSTQGCTSTTKDIVRQCFEGVDEKEDFLY